MLMRDAARDENSNSCSERPANRQEAVRLHGRRNAMLRVANTPAVVEIDPVLVPTRTRLDGRL